MKKTMFFCCMLLSGFCFAQKTDVSKVPDGVKNVFNKTFPGITAVKWEKEKGNYEANFSQNVSNISALFDANGVWLETETAVALTALPPKAASYIAANYKGDKIKEAAILKMANGDTNYEAEVNGTDLIFDGNGSFIKAIKD